MGLVSSLAYRSGRTYRFLKEWGARILATVNESPIFILGNQKSGTTAIGALLGEHTSLSVTLDLPPQNSTLIVDIYRGNASLESLLSHYTLEFSRDIVKVPNLTFLYPHLCKRFPSARFAIVVRDPRANIRSILDRLDLPGDQEDLQLHRHWESLTRYEGMYEAWITVLDSSWMGIKGDHYIDMLAGRWRHAVQTYLKHDERIELIRYEDFLKDKVGTITDLADRLDLSPQNDIGDKVDRQYQPRGQRRSVGYREFFGVDNLRRIESTCAEEMRKLGYTEFRELTPPNE